MARNEEKANSLLNRWVQMKSDERLGMHRKRPYNQDSVETVAEAERWRSEVVNLMSSKVYQIQNRKQHHHHQAHFGHTYVVSLHLFFFRYYYYYFFYWTAYLGEIRIRELNDEINRLKGELHRWNLRIVALGGQNHERGRRIYDKNGNLISSGRDYLYFGAAKDLPGVKERLAQPKRPSQPTRQDRLRNLDRHINPEYYNFCDADGGTRPNPAQELLLAEEAAAEKRLLEASTRRWEERHKAEEEDAATAMVGRLDGNSGGGNEDECDVGGDYDAVLLRAVDDIEMHGGNVFAIAKEEEEKRKKEEEQRLEQKKRELMEKYLPKEYLN